MIANIDRRIDMSAGAAGATAAIAAAAAAKKAAEMREEEEEMTTYKGGDFDGWEFKIVRSNTGKFKDSQFLEKVRQEEQQNGWELLEKFDNNRVRFKRRIEHRSRDTHAAVDPYRGTVGIGSGELAGVIIGIILLVAGLAIGLIMYFEYEGSGSESVPIPAIFAAVGFVALLAVLIYKKSRR